MFDAQSFLASVTSRPGVYCMRDADNKVLYVGKAKNLHARLSSYFRALEDIRIQHMVSKIAHIDVTITHSENEALILESSLIKSLKPKYNVIFRDDKSYPYLFLSKHKYPQLVYLRGKSKHAGTYFGPYPSAFAVKKSLQLLQKIFKIRQCDDTFFSNRSRPCLQYQIKRCSAPCVGYIAEEIYAKDVENVSLFLAGKQAQIIENLVHNMENAAKAQDFELAANLRDQVANLRHLTEQQVVHKQKGNADVIACANIKGQFCVQLLYIRDGQILDSRSFFPKQTEDSDIKEVLRSFIIQFYLDQEDKLDYPQEIILNEAIDDQDLIASSLSVLMKRQIKILEPNRGEKTKWVMLATANALQALERKTSARSAVQKRWLELKKILGIANGLNRIECFDISHTFGEATMASCVVFDQNGPQKAEYRRYNIEVKANDDYAAMEQVLTKRYIKRKQEDKVLPDVIMVDGGKGQLHRAQKALLECQILDVLIIAIAKGEGRKPGLETLYVAKPQSTEEHIISLAPTTGAFHLLQHIRDEAHRFAITGHRRKRNKARTTSTLESIEGIGAKRRQKLLNYFGGLQGLMSASQEAIAKVPGIGAALAATIYESLHGK
ncbi:MAG: excinuclease ABC subunit UvrC [Proteobacteria bacterium]|nr:excinuclease ABC subunit UvrC [Pseudomonadota bacterium]